MPLPRPTEEERTAFYDWFAANGVNPRTVPQHTSLEIRTHQDGTRVIHYDEYVLTDDGLVQTDPEDPDSVWIRPATAPCLVEPAAWLINPYVRLRRLPGDPRLYITHDGRTQHGYPYHAWIDGSDLILKLTTQDPSTTPQAVPDALRIPVARLLLHDVQHLVPQSDVPEAPGMRQLAAILDTARTGLSQAVPPACGHEDVIETPELGNPDTPGTCMWCPAPLVRRHGTDSWVPA